MVMWKVSEIHSAMTTLVFRFGKEDGKPARECQNEQKSRLTAAAGVFVGIMFGRAD